MARVALIDGDSFAYRCAAAVERTKYMVVPNDARQGPKFFDTYKEAAEEDLPIWSRKEVGTLKEAADSLEKALERSINRAQCAVFHVYIGGLGPTFRDHLARCRRYKGNRGAKESPKYLGDLRAYLIKHWGAVVASGEEVDDILSYTSRELVTSGSIPVIVGNDKDLDQNAGEHYDWVKDKLYTVSNAEARLRMWVQVLSGDVADNVGGCFGVGEARALKVVQECVSDGWSDERMWQLVCSAYEKSQERVGCPYLNLDPVDVAKEMYDLVRLKQHRHEELNYRGLFPQRKDPEGKKKKNGETLSSSSTNGADSASAEERGTEDSGSSSPSRPISVEVRSYDSSRSGEERDYV